MIGLQAVCLAYFLVFFASYIVENYGSYGKPMILQSLKQSTLTGAGSVLAFILAVFLWPWLLVGYCYIGLALDKIALRKLRKTTKIISYDIKPVLGEPFIRAAALINFDNGVSLTARLGFRKRKSRYVIELPIMEQLGDQGEMKEKLFAVWGKEIEDILFGFIPNLPMETVPTEQGKEGVPCQC